MSTGEAKTASEQRSIMPSLAASSEVKFPVSRCSRWYSCLASSSRSAVHASFGLLACQSRAPSPAPCPASRSQPVFRVSCLAAFCDCLRTPTAIPIHINIYIVYNYILSAFSLVVIGSRVSLGTCGKKLAKTQK